MKSFLDTYAIIEIANGNPAYSKFSLHDCCTSIFNLFELTYHIVKSGKKDSDFFAFKPLLTDISTDWLLEAAKFRTEYSSRNFSYADAIGYVASIKIGCVFVTGDQQFKDMPNVEFIK